MGRHRKDGTPAQIGAMAACHPERSYKAFGLCGLCYRSRLKKSTPDRLNKSREQGRNTLLKRKYGITVAQYDTMLSLQGGVCKICSLPPKKVRLHVDHDHKTGRVRGLLCWWCNNRLLGRRVKPDLLLRAYEYVKSDFDGRFV